MSRTNKKVPPTLNINGKEEYKVDEKSIKTAGQKRSVKAENRKDRREAATAANLKQESNDFPPKNSVKSEFIRSF